MQNTLNIQITSTYQLQCSILNEQETIIKLSDDHQNFYSPTISFSGNKITICPTSQNDSIEFLKEWIENPDEFKIYEIEFLNKQYHLIPEVLFAIIINEFKMKIEKHTIIDETIVMIPSRDCHISERIKTSLEAIGLKNIYVNPLTYDYTEQGEQLMELLENKQKIENLQRKFDNNEKIEIDYQDMLSSQFLKQNVAIKYTFEERNKLKLTTLDNYCVFIASRYLDTLEDHINLVKVSKRFRNNMEKFHYNPISVTYETIHWFPNTETLHLYKENDEYLKINRIISYVNWFRRIEYHEIDKVREENKGKNFEFKRIVWSKNDTQKFFETFNSQRFFELEKEDQIEDNDSIDSGEISEEENDNNNNYNNNNQFGMNVFPRRFNGFGGFGGFGCFNLPKLIIPSEVKEIEKDCLSNVINLTNITVPLNETRVVCGNKLFSIPYFDSLFDLPNTIKVINGKKVHKSILQIPNYVTSMNLHYIDICKKYLKQLSIPDTMKDIPKDVFKEFKRLTNITLPLNQSQFVCGNKIYSIPHFKEDIQLPEQIEIINNEKVDKSIMIIPSSVTSIDWDYIGCCQEFLKCLSIPTTVTNMEDNFLKDFMKLTSISYPLNENQIVCGNKIFKKTQFEEDIILPSSIKMINNKEVNASNMIIPSSITSINWNEFNNYKNLLKQLTIPETVTNLQVDSFINLNNLEELTLPNKYELYGNRLFYNNENCLYSIELLTSLKKVNGKDLKPLETFTIPTHITKLADCCFANCKELTEIKGLEQIKEFGKRCFMNCPMLNKDETMQMKDNVSTQLNDILTETEMKQLEEWTELKCSDIIFNSDLDNWSISSSVFNERILGNSKLLFLIENEDGEKFGYYLNTKVIEKYYQIVETDSKSFHFNLFSNNRLKEPMKFEVKSLKKGGYIFFDKSNPVLIRLGDISLSKENKKNQSYCLQTKENFNYHLINNALCGKTGIINKIIPKRIIVIQMN